MKWLLLNIILLCFVPVQDLESLRQAYKEAGQDDSKIVAFGEMVKDISKKNDPVLIGYKGAALTLEAKIQKTVKEKKSVFVKGVEFIELALEIEPNNIELHFIRLGIQENTPKLLKYKDKIEEDKAFIINHFNGISSKNLKGHIEDYIKQSQVFSETEKESLKL